MAAGGTNTKAKRPWENHLQWQSRIAQLYADERDRNEPLVPVEAQRHGDYRDADVMHVETQTIAVTKRNWTKSSVQMMFERGGLTEEQVEAAGQIEAAMRLVQRDVAVRCASLEARVDNPGSARGVLVERLAEVIIQKTYTEWRQKLPMPRRLVIDMLTLPQSMYATARSYGVGWPKARDRVVDALNEWIRVRTRVWEALDEEEIERFYTRIESASCG